MVTTRLPDSSSCPTLHAPLHVLQEAFPERPACYSVASANSPVLASLSDPWSQGLNLGHQAQW